jgi:hypothetical protein
MTIEVFGHVQSLENYGGGKVKVHIHVERSRMTGKLLGEDPVISIIASLAETDVYRPGMQVRMLITPTGVK